MVYQSQRDDCGKAVVRNILCLLEKSDSFQTVFLKSDCRSFYDIKEELNSFDANYKAYEVVSLDKIEKRYLPAILLFNQEGKKHFVILTKKKREKVTILDPNFGEYDLSYEEFYSYYLGKALLKQDYQKVALIQKTSLLKSSEKASYLLCFFFQVILTCLLIFLTGMEKTLLYCFLCLCGLGILLLLQNLLNSSISKRLDKQVLQPYMKESKNKEDFLPLSRIISLEVKRYSNSISFLSLTIILIFLFALNSYYLAFLSLIPILFFFIRMPLKKEKNKCDLFCSAEEKQYLDLLKDDFKEAQKHYNLAKRKSHRFYLTTCLSYLIEFLTEFLLVLGALSLRKSLNINQVFFYFGLCFSLSLSLERLYESLFNQKEKICLQNRLSFQLDLFLLKTKSELKYNNKDKGGDSFNERSTTCPRISRSDESKEKNEGNLQAGIRTDFEDLRKK